MWKAKSKPHAAFSAITHGVIGHWMYFLERITTLMQPIKDSISRHFLLALTRQSGVSDLEHELLALPEPKKLVH